jgi:hypothetical protein
MKTRESVTISLTADDNRAVATMTLPGMGSGATVTRSGRDDREALASTLRGLADLIDSRQRAARREGDTTWVRVSVDVDVKVSEAEALRAEGLEESSMRGDGVAANELMDLSLAWLSTALHDPDARDWQSLSWSRTEECDDFNLA